MCSGMHIDMHIATCAAMHELNGCADSIEIVANDIVMACIVIGPIQLGSISF